MIVCATLPIPDFFSRATSGKDCGDILFHEHTCYGALCDQTTHATGLALLLHDALSRAGETELVLGLRGTLHKSDALECSVAEEAHHGGLRGRETGGAGTSLGWRVVRTGGIATDSVGRCSGRSVLLHSPLLPRLGLLLCGLLVGGAALPLSGVEGDWRDGGMVWVHIGHW